MAVLVGDTITEEALPTYESWLLDVDGITKDEPQGWSKWIRNVDGGREPSWRPAE
jgi:acyl-[acyl-carrier-protein] desaturase